MDSFVAPQRARLIENNYSMCVWWKYIFFYGVVVQISKISIDRCFLLVHLKIIDKIA